MVYKIFQHFRIKLDLSSEGTFLVSWIPTPQAYACLSISPPYEQTVFSVVSNSTITNLTFDSGFLLSRNIIYIKLHPKHNLAKHEKPKYYYLHVVLNCLQ
ncbi:MAG: hypothetical protein QXG39_06155 [Candidatus Aenigmatarchaeota archaeon]